MICWEDHMNPASCLPERMAVAEADRERQRLILQVIEELRAEGEPVKRNYPIRVTEWPAHRIKWLRVSRGLSIKQVSDLVGVSTSAWQWWERGLRTPRDEYIRRLDEIEAGDTPDSERINQPRLLEHPEWTADRIKRLRVELGYKQHEIANLVGVTMQSWSLWEQGINRPRPENIKRLIELDGGGRIA